MSGEGEQREPNDATPRPARRSSPRLAIRRLVIIASPRWKKYREVQSKNISRRSLMVLVPDDPPAQREPIAVWMGVDNHERPRRWNKGHVVRLQPEAGAEGETGVVIQLSDPKAEAIWCLVPRGDENAVILPRSIPRFQKATAKGQDRKTVNERVGASVPLTLKPAIELDMRSPDGRGATAEPVPLERPDTEVESVADDEPYKEISIEGGPGVIEEAISPVDGSPLGDLDRDDGEAADDMPEEVTQVDAKIPGERPPAEAPGEESQDLSLRAVIPPPPRPPFPPPPAAPPSHVSPPPTHGSPAAQEPAAPSFPARADAVPGDEALDTVPTAKLSLMPVLEAILAAQTPPPPGEAGAAPKTGRPAPPPVPPDARKPLRPAVEIQRPSSVPPAAPPSTAADEPIKAPAAPRPAQARPSSAAASPAPDLQPSSSVPTISTASSGMPAKAPAFSKGIAPMIGIDFGTTYSKVALFDRGDVILIEDPRSTASTRSSVPSVVAYQPDGTVLVGEPAQELLAVDPSLVISSVKRAMGLKYTDPLANGILGSLGCPTAAGPNDSILFDMHGTQVTVPEAAARILIYMREMASEYVGAKVKEAVLTLPVDFDRAAKRELELAARSAGIEIKALVPEPVAAAMGCGHDGRGSALIAVYDLGGGTFDASVVEVGQDRFVVRGAAGDRWLGGDDFDELIARYVADEFQKKSGISLHNRVVEWRRLLFACEEAKRWLSTLNSVDVVLPRAAMTAEGTKTLLVPLTRAAFDEATKSLVQSTLEICKQAARRAKVSPQDVDSLLVTGGSTRIPYVRMAAQQLFQKTPAVGIHPQHAVVIGAAVRAAVLSGASVPEDYIERLRGHGTVGRTIGLALAGGTTEHIIESSQRAPVVAHRQYSTHRDGQTTIRIEIVQGTSEHTAENQQVGGFIIEGLPKKKAGVISLDVYFELSSTGTLYVTAQERSTGQRAQGIFDLDTL